MQGPVQEQPLSLQSESEDGNGYTHLQHCLSSRHLPNCPGGAGPDQIAAFRQDFCLALTDAGIVNSQDHRPRAQLFFPLPQVSSTTGILSREGQGYLLKAVLHRLFESSQLIHASPAVQKDTASGLQSVLDLGYGLGADQAGHVATDGLQHIRPKDNHASCSLADQDGGVHQSLHHTVAEDLRGSEADRLCLQL